MADYDIVQPIYPVDIGWPTGYHNKNFITHPFLGGIIMNLRTNMAFGAVVVAGIIGWISGFASEHLVSAEPLKQDAVKIEAAAAPTAGGASAKAAGPEAILDLIAKADVERGKSVAKACAACHMFDNNGKNGVGPNLYGVIGRKKQSAAGYSYSGELAKQGGDTWTYAEIAKFLWKPKAYAANTKMTYAGIKKPEDRAAVIAYLRTLASAPHAEPTQAEIDADKKELGAQ